MKNFIYWILILAGVFINFNAYSHSEHNKPRFVSSTGQDVGRCDKKESPCKSIKYAAQHANKGDNIRVAAGNYQIDDVDTLFFLLSQTLPIKGNYSQESLFSERNSSNITRLTGVPLKYAEPLSKKGFTVIVDSKGLTIKKRVQLQSQLKTYTRMQKSQAETVCSNGTAGDFPCNNIDLLSHVALSEFSTNPAEANDIWGHYDLNTNKEYALIGLRNGIGIVDISEPTAPSIVTTISSQSTIWRDLKVYQFYNESEKRWKSYAYVIADNASVGLMIIDLNGLPNSAQVVATDTTDVSAHNVYLSNVDYSTGTALSGVTPYLHIAGSDKNGGAYNTYELTNPESITPIFKPTGAFRTNYTHDVSSMVLRDSRKDSQCVNGSEHCEVFFDFNENNFQLWDKTNNSNPVRLSTTSYANANYVHSGWYTEDKLVVIVHDELDEQNAGLNTTVRFFEMSNLTAPTQISTWTGSTSAIDHNGFVRGNRYYMSNYERGLTVLDITDPTNPTEVGNFDTYPFNNSASFNGAWGVYPFLPSGNILVSDINSGLYILRDNTQNLIKGSLKFNQKNYTVSEGNMVEITVERLNGSQDDIQVSWELTPGSADITDYEQVGGNLTWLDGDNSPKTISILVTDDNSVETEEMFFIRLFDPKNGATLSTPNLSTVTIASNIANRPPIVNAGDDQNNRLGDEVILTASASDPDGDNLTYLWEQMSGTAVTLTNNETLVAKYTANSLGTFEFKFTATDPDGSTSFDSTMVEIVNLNRAPTVNAGNNFQVNVGDNVALKATANDEDNDPLTVNWSQISGPQVTLSSTDNLETSFTARTVGRYQFKVEVKDSSNASATSTVEVVVNKVSVEPPKESSGGGSSNFIGLLALAFWMSRRKLTPIQKNE